MNILQARLKPFLILWAVFHLGIENSKKLFAYVKGDFGHNYFGVLNRAAEFFQPIFPMSDSSARLRNWCDPGTLKEQAHGSKLPSHESHKFLLSSRPIFQSNNTSSQIPNSPNQEPHVYSVQFLETAP